MAKDMNTVDWIAYVLVIIGALNWGLTAFGFNVVDIIFGVASTISTVVYALVGLSGLWMIYAAFK